MARTFKPQEQTLAAMHYPSIAAMIATLDAPNAVRNSTNATIVHKYMTDVRGNDWMGAGVTSAAQVRENLRHGYAYGETIVRTMLVGITEKLPRALGHNRTLVRGDAGDQLDIHAVNKGNADKAWTSAKRRVKSGTGIVRIVVDICGNGDQSAHSLAWRGVTAVTLCQVMEKAGYSVEIVAAIATCNSDVNHRVNTLTTVTVKPRNTKADIGFLAAVLVMSGFFRTLGFASIVRCVDSVGKTCESGLGHYMQAANVLPVQSKVTQLTVDGSVNSEAQSVEFVRASVQLLQHSTMSKEGRR